jgi:hypothetical protein
MEKTTMCLQLATRAMFAFQNTLTGRLARSRLVLFRLSGWAQISQVKAGMDLLGAIIHDKAKKY